MIGIGAYSAAPRLPNAVPDAMAMGQALGRQGYAVTTVVNPDRDTLLVALARLRLQSQEARVTVIYVAAHGAFVGGESFIYAADTSGSLSEAIPVRVLAQAISDRPRQKLILIDACREPPFNLSPKPQPPPQAPMAGLQLEYAAQPGAPAYDGGAGAHGPFAAAWVAALGSEISDFGELARRVRLDVLRATGGRQIPWSQSSLLRPLDLVAAPQTQ
ncbi:MAG: caspase family protein [Pseudomonadota bacterium]